MNINCSYILLGIRCMPTDSGFSLFHCVTGGQLSMPHTTIIESNTNHFTPNDHKLILELRKTINKLDKLNSNACIEYMT